MIKRFIIIIFCIGITSILYSQSISLSYSPIKIDLYYQPLFYKSFFDYQSHFSASSLLFLIKTKNADKSVIGNRHGIRLNYLISEKISLSLNYSKVEGGQKSDVITEFNNDTYYVITYKSTQASLLLSSLLKKFNNQKINLIGTVGLSVDFFEEYFIKDYIYRNHLDEFTRGCCVSVLWSNSGGIRNSINKGRIKYGIEFELGSSYDISNNLNLYLIINYSYFTDLFDKNNLYRIEGDLSFIGARIGLEIYLDKL